MLFQDITPSLTPAPFSLNDIDEFSDGFADWLAELFEFLLAPRLHEIDLADSSDSGLRGDGVTMAGQVALTGRAQPGAIVEVVGTGISATVGADGRFTLEGLKIVEGPQVVELRIVDDLGFERSEAIILTGTPPLAEANAVQIWVQAALDAIRDLGKSPLDASRALAIEGVAIHDALAAIDGRDGVLASLRAPDGADLNAAVAGAAHQALCALFPKAKAHFDAVLAAQLAKIADGPGESAGLAHGRAVADAVLALRQRDNADATVDYQHSNEPGRWQPDDSGVTPLKPHWGGVTLFMKGAKLDALKAAPPPALDSAQYAADFNEVKSLGAINSTTRTADQREISKFWADPDGTYTPPGHWMHIAMKAAQDQNLSLGETARLAATLGCGLADAGVAAWKSKYDYNVWRPDHAIWRADEDGNPLTQSDASWRPCVKNPPFPEYVSGHSTFSATSAAILSKWFGENYAFSSSALGLSNATRSFTSFDQAAEEAGRSRIYGGIHFDFANREGLKLGDKVGEATLNSFADSRDLRAPVLLFDKLEGARTALTGHAFDDRAGVSSITAVLDGCSARLVSADDRGRFSLNLEDSFQWRRDGAHELKLTIADAAGNVTQTTLQVTRDSAADADARWTVTEIDGACWVAGVEVQSDWLS